MDWSDTMAYGHRPVVWGKALRPDQEQAETSGSGMKGTAPSDERAPRRTGMANRVVRAKAGAEPDPGDALRSIYQRTIEEEIPEDILALLRKLD
jgi:hypothetical protein